jgi:hypothetical protein
MELLNEANKMNWPEELLFNRILVGIAGAKTRNRKARYFKRLAVAAALAVLLCAGSVLIFSADARIVAAGAIQAIETVFTTNKSGQIVQKPANTAFYEPANVITTHQSDAELSKKMGVQVCFPKTLAADIAVDFVLQYKADGVGLTKPIDYQSYQNIFSQITAAITDQHAFNSLWQYRPFRTVGGMYEDQQGRKAGFCVYNKLIPLYIPEGVSVTDTVQTKVASYNAQWFGVSYLNYPNDDLTRKPTGMKTVHVLLWSSGNTTYEVLAVSPNLSMKEVVGLAEAFMKAQG